MPPVVRKQSPNPVTKRKGSILDRAVPVTDVKARFVKMVVYGENRSGKTTFAGSWPKPMLVVSFEPSEEGGQTSISNMKGIKVLRYKQEFDTLDDFKTLVYELKEDDHYVTNVLDTGTSFQDAVLANLLGLQKLPEQLSFGGVSTDMYRKRAEQVKEMLRPFLALEKHTLVLNKEKDHRPPQMGDNGKPVMDMTPDFMKSIKLDSFIASDMGGSVVGWLHDACPYICRLYLAKKVRAVTYKLNGKDKTRYEETEDMERRLRTLYHPNFAAGFRAPKGTEIPEHITDPDFDSVAKYFTSAT